MRNIQMKQYYIDIYIHIYIVNICSEINNKYNLDCFFNRAQYQDRPTIKSNANWWLKLFYLNFYDNPLKTLKFTVITSSLA